MSLNKLVDAVFNRYEDAPDFIKLSKEARLNGALIDGEIVGKGLRKQEVYSPIQFKVNGELKEIKLGGYACANSETAIKALESTVARFNNGSGVWQKLELNDRIKVCAEFLEMMKAAKEYIVKMLMWETAKSLVESEAEFDRTADYIDNTLKTAAKFEIDSQVLHSENGFFATFRREPVGIALVAGPSNYPLYETYSLLIPALVMGNSAILKLPRLGVLMNLPLIEALKKCFPKGAINVLAGHPDEIFPPIFKSGKLDLFLYMGGGDRIDEFLKLAPNPKKLRTVMGLSAKNAAIITASADLKQAAKDLALGALAFNGQRCAALKIAFVHESIEREFKSELLSAFEAVSIGMPWEKDVRITPLQDPSRIRYIKSLIDEAIGLGASLTDPRGGTAIGNIMLPGLIWDVKPNMRIFWEEQFAPITPVAIFNSLDEPIEYISRSEFAQQASIFSQNEEEIVHLANSIRRLVGRVNINHKCQRGPDSFPFSAKKSSGNAIFSVIETLKSVSVETVVSSKDSDIINYIK